MRTVAALLRLTLGLPLNAIAQNRSQVTVTDVIRLPRAHEAFFVLKAGTARNSNNCEYDELNPTGSHMISGTQVRAARAVLGWSMRDLALQSFVSVAAIKLIESREERTDEGRRQLEAVQAALEAAGIYFEGVSIASKRVGDDL